MPKPVVGAAELSAAILKISDRLAEQCSQLTFDSPVACVYNPLIYARPAWRQYVERYIRHQATILMLGMNPGPFGMAQTGIPFGDIPHVRDWMGITGPVGQPPQVHPQRPIQGFACTRVEGSGKRLWGFFSQLFPDPEAFFRRCSVLNYCPLVFMDHKGANITPDKLAKSERQALFGLCDQALAEIVGYLQPRALVGIGAFAKQRLETVRAINGIAPGITPLLMITHPSPANPRANRGWDEAVQASLTKAGLWPL